MTNDASFTAFMEEAWLRYLPLATLLSGDRHRGEDLLQDCLVRLYRRWDALSRHGTSYAYLRRMLVTHNVSRWRRTRRESLTADTPELADPRCELVEPYEPLRRALMTLSPQQRAVVVLRYYADLSLPQVAEDLGCTVGTIKTQSSRAMAKLRQQLPTLHPDLKETSR